MPDSMVAWICKVRLQSRNVAGTYLEVAILHVQRCSHTLSSRQIRRPVLLYVLFGEKMTAWQWVGISLAVSPCAASRSDRRNHLPKRSQPITKQRRDLTDLVHDGKRTPRK